MIKTRETDSHTKGKIFMAASEIFEEKGFTGARMQEIADRAGINKALLHYYFRSKDQLFKAVFVVLLKKMFEKIISILKEDLTFKEKIKKFLDEHIEFMIKNPKLPLFLLNEMAQNPEFSESISETVRLGDLKTMLYEQHAKELKGYGIKKSDFSQLMVTIVSFSVFPMAAHGMISVLMPEFRERKKFNEYMRERKEFASGLLFAALKHRKK